MYAIEVTASWLCIADYHYQEYERQSFNDHLTLIVSLAKTAATKKTVTKRPAKKAAPKRVKKTAAKRPAKKGGKKAAAKKAAPAKWFRPLIGFCTEWVIDVILFCY